MASYRDVVIKGDPKAIKGFLGAFVAVKRIKHGVVFVEDHAIDGGYVKRLVHGTRDYEHIIVSTVHHKSLISAIKRANNIDIEIVSDQKIKRASFEFKFETFSRKVAGNLRRLYRNPPAGIRIIDPVVKEEFDPSAKGVELYSPTHHYQLKGKATAVGDVEALIKLQQRFHDHEFIDVKDIQIEHR